MGGARRISRRVRRLIGSTRPGRGSILVSGSEGAFFEPLAENDVSLFDPTSLDELARRLADSVPESMRSFGRDLQDNFKAVLQAQLSKLDLVSRQEFDVQSAVLARTQAALSAMETRLADLESKLPPR